MTAFDRLDVTTRLTDNRIQFQTQSSLATPVCICSSFYTGHRFTHEKRVEMYIYL